MKDQKTVAVSNLPKQWRKPELLRLEAGKAEIGPSTNVDAINTAS
jgi:hypothetical protein